MNWFEQTETRIARPPIKQLPEASLLRHNPGTWVRLEEARTWQAAGAKVAASLGPIC